MATGIILDYHFSIPTLFWIILCGFSAGGYFLSEIIYNKKFSNRLYVTTIFCYLGIIISFGGTWHSLFDYREQPVEAKALETYTWQELTFSGKVQQIKQTSTGKYQIDVAIDSTIFPGKLRWEEHYRVRAVLDPEERSLPNKLSLGSHITFSATVYPLEEKRNPAQFDYKNYLASEGIYTQVGIQRFLAISTNPNTTFGWTSLRKQTLDAIDNNFSNQNASLAKALLIGYKNELDRNEKITFSRAGLSHIMAVSGLHVGFILAPFWFLIPYLWTIRHGKKIGLLLIAGTLYFYAGLTEFSPSVTRASLVGIFLTYGKLFHKVHDSKNLTAVAALIILVINPSDLFSIGFQLSFGAVYIILLIAPVIQRKLPDWIQHHWIGTPVMVVIISLIVQLGLFPLLAYYFGEFSIVGPLANAFVVPILGIFVPYALLLLATVNPFSTAFAQFLNTPVDWFLGKLNWFVDWAASLPWSWMQVHIDSLLFFAIWIAAIFLIATLRISVLRWKILALLLLFLSIDQAVDIANKLRPAQLELTVFDVGQGDAALVSTPTGSHFLIDAGRWQPDYNSAKYVIIPHLKAEGITKLDGVFLSHPHADHIGGILELIRNFPIDTIYNSGMEYESQLYQTYLREAANHQIPIRSLKAGDQIILDPSILMFAYGPEKAVSSSNVNNHSLILELIYGETEFLFMGDAEESQERRLTRNYPELLDTDFLKVPHHGSKTSSTSILLNKTTADIGIVSLAKQNRFGHPNKKAVMRLRNHIPKIYFTSLKGAVQFYSDGYQIFEAGQ